MDLRISAGGYPNPRAQFSRDTVGYDDIAYYNAVPWSFECSWKKSWYEYGPSIAINTTSYQYSQLHFFLGLCFGVFPVDRGIFSLRGSLGLGLGYAHVFIDDEIRDVPGIRIEKIEDRLFAFVEPKAEISIGDPGNAYLILSLSERFKYGWHMPTADGLLLGFGYRFLIGDSL